MNLAAPTGHIFIGNILFIVCCAFYLAWWLVRFRPVNPITGFKIGLLLVPAALVGLVAVYYIVWGVSDPDIGNTLFPKSYVIWGALVAYVVFYAVTRWLLHRQVTSELTLIVVWGALALSEVNALYGAQLFSHDLLSIFIVIIAAAVVIDLVCYVLYYRLDGWKSYIDGLIPLVLGLLVLAGVTVCMAVNSGQ